MIYRFQMRFVTSKPNTKTVVFSEEQVTNILNRINTTSGYSVVDVRETTPRNKDNEVIEVAQIVTIEVDTEQEIGDLVFGDLCKA